MIGLSSHECVTHTKKNNKKRCSLQPDMICHCLFRQFCPNIYENYCKLPNTESSGWSLYLLSSASFKKTFLAFHSITSTQFKGNGEAGKALGKIRTKATMLLISTKEFSFWSFVCVEVLRPRQRASNWATEAGGRSTSPLFDTEC